MKRGNPNWNDLVHWRVDDQRFDEGFRPACYAGAYNLKWTSDASRVTCLECQHRLGRGSVAALSAIARATQERASMLIDVCHTKRIEGSNIYVPSVLYNTSRKPFKYAGVQCVRFKGHIYRICAIGSNMPYIVTDKPLSRRKVKRCNQCVAVSVNGVASHERSCPNRNRDKR